MNQIADYQIFKDFGISVFHKTKKGLKHCFKPFFELPNLDSNQDKRHQKPSYYHYTIGQTFVVLSSGCSLLTMQIYVEFSILQIKKCVNY